MILDSLPLIHGIRVGHRERGHGADGLSLLRVSSFGFQQRKPQPRRVALHRAPVLTWEDGADKRQEGEKNKTKELNESKALRGLTLNVWSSYTKNEPERILKSKNRYFLIKMLHTLLFFILSQRNDKLSITQLAFQLLLPWRLKPFTGLDCLWTYGYRLGF